MYSKLLDMYMLIDTLRMPFSTTVFCPAFVYSAHRLHMYDKVCPVGTEMLDC